MSGYPSVGGYILITWLVIGLFWLGAMAAGLWDGLSGRRYYVIVTGMALFLATASTILLVATA